MMKNNLSFKTINLKSIFIKAVLLLIIINFAWILISKIPIGKISLYNIIFKGRDRFPFGENPKASFNLSLFNLDAMFASHEINNENSDSEKIHVGVIGDSSIWGFLQKPNNTLTGLLNKRFANYETEIVFHNLGYPSISILKDLLILDRISKYEIDLVLWFTTLEALPIDKQFDIPIVKNNPSEVNSLIEKYDLSLPVLEETIYDNTLWNQKRNISDLIHLQLYGILWDATGVDQEYPDFYNQAQRDFPEIKDEYYGIKNGKDLENNLALEIIHKGIEINDNTDFVLVNEPILISEGENSHRQYNFYYPKWAYDQYRLCMKRFTQENEILYYDLWDLIPESDFTNSAIHISEDAEQILADETAEIVIHYLISRK